MANMQEFAANLEFVALKNQDGGHEMKIGLIKYYSNYESAKNEILTYILMLS